MCGQSWSKSKWSFFITDYVTIPTIYINILLSGKTQKAIKILPEAQ